MQGGDLTLCFATAPKIQDVPLPPNIQSYDSAADVTASRENDAKRRRLSASRRNSILAGGGGSAGNNNGNKTLFGQ